MNTSYQELKEKNSQLANKVELLQMQLAEAKASEKLKIDAKEMEIKMSMMQELRDAHDKGFKACQEQLKMLNEMRGANMS